MKKFGACHLCFRDFGLRVEIQMVGQATVGVCSNCGNAHGFKLQREQLLAVCEKYFQGGTQLTGRGWFASIIMVDEQSSKSDSFGSLELQHDVKVLQEKFGIRCFFYGPPMWRLGKPPTHDGEVVWADEDIDRIVDSCQGTLLTKKSTLFRVRVNLKESELVKGQFCTPPSHISRSNLRFDSSSLPICYLGKNLESCIHEVRATLADEIFVAALVPKKSLSILNLNKCKGDEDPFNDPSIWLRSLLFQGDTDAYDVCRRIAAAAKSRGYDGVQYPSYFQQAGSSRFTNIAAFGYPVTDGRLECLGISRVILKNLKYRIQLGPTTEFDFESFDP